MKTSKIILANIILIVAFLPCILIFNEGDSIIPNVMGLLYAFLLYKYGMTLAPKVVKDYFGYITRWDVPLD